MTTVGEAYIAIRADMRPFTRGLEDEVRKAAEKIEKDIGAAVAAGIKSGASEAEKDGEEIGSKLGSGVRRKLTDRSTVGTFLEAGKILGAALGSALDDGISALPPQAKAGIVAAIIAATPAVAAALAGTITAALAGSVVVIGAALTSQFEVINTRGGEVLDHLRVRATQAAEPFGTEILAALDLFESRLDSTIGPLLQETFDISDDFVLPLLEGALGGVEEFLEGINDALGDAGPFVDELAASMRTLGFAVGEAFRILASTGEDGATGLRDLTFVVADLLIFMAEFVALLTAAYDLFRDLSMVVPLFNPIMALFGATSNDAAAASREQADALNQVGTSFVPTIRLTKEQEEELRKLSRAMKSFSAATYDAVQNQIDFEAALDDIADAIKENGPTLDIRNKEGRAVAQTFLDALEELEAGLQKRIEIGELTAQQAQELYNIEISNLRALAKNAGIGTAEFENLYASIILAASARLDAQAMGLIQVDATLAESVAEAKALIDRLTAISRFRLPSIGTRAFSELAEGGVVHSPTHALIGEAGSEVVIPLTKPSRAAQLMQQTGLDRMLASNGATVVSVYIGNEAVDSHMIRVVEQSNTQQARQLSYGPRGA